MTEELYLPAFDLIEATGLVIYRYGHVRQVLTGVTYKQAVDMADSYTGEAVMITGPGRSEDGKLGTMCYYFKTGGLQNEGINT